MTRMVMLATAGSLSLALVTPLSSAANAASRDAGDETVTSASATATDKRRCKPRLLYKIHRLSPRNFFVPRTRFIDGPGGEMTATVEREAEVLAYVETGSEREKAVTTGDLVRILRRAGVPHLEQRHMVLTGHSYTREISKGMYGNMWYRVFGYRIGWSSWSVLGSCRQIRVSSGIANVPARVEGWHYWETKHPQYKGRVLSPR
ncbi:hypothetical protein [Nonomuraea roseola]|uniref:Uncharacterized protein n=1 Tax=Nonomuraea roseola TaxID=46179 RepID=A0ABV5PUS0_9ACTN